MSREIPDEGEAGKSWGDTTHFHPSSSFDPAAWLLHIRNRPENSYPPTVLTHQNPQRKYIHNTTLIQGNNCPVNYFLPKKPPWLITSLEHPYNMEVPDVGKHPDTGLIHGLCYLDISCLVNQVLPPSSLSQTDIRVSNICTTTQCHVHVWSCT